MKKLNDGTATLVIRQKVTAEDNSKSTTEKPATVKNGNGNQEQMTSERKEPEKLEAKRWIEFLFIVFSLFFNDEQQQNSRCDHVFFVHFC